MDFKAIFTDIKELYIPAGRRIPYRFVLVPLAAVFLLVLASSIIRAPTVLEPKPNTAISRQPVFQFKIIKNMFYKDYAVQLRYADLTAERGKIKITVFKEGETVIVTTPARLRKQAEVELLITVNKGLGPLTLWRKTFTYDFTTGL